MTFKDLKSAASTALTAKAATAAALVKATDDDNHAGLDVTSTQATYAQAVFAAPGHTVVYAEAVPIAVDQSDGKVVTTFTVASGGDPVPA